MTTPTFSEEFITRINQNVFYREFTFDRSEIITDQNNRIELADNILWIDDMLIVFQIKERNELNSKGQSNIENWFINKVLKKAKDQIKNTNTWIRSQHSIDLKNRDEQVITMHPEDIDNIINIIIYHVDAPLPDSFVPDIKYKTQDGLFIHILSSEDYYHICRYLITPAELSDYLKFREDLLSYYPQSPFTEQYILAHYFHNSNDLKMNVSYIDDLEEICTRIEINDNKFNLFPFLDMFRDTVVRTDDNLEYIAIVKELAKLNRQEILWFKQRLLEVINCQNPDPCEIKPLYLERTGCAIMIMKPRADGYVFWENILRNNTEDYKYAKHAAKGLGVIVMHDGNDIILNWCLDYTPWKYNAELEETSKMLTSLLKSRRVQEKPIYELLMK